MSSCLHWLHPGKIYVQKASKAWAACVILLNLRSSIYYKNIGNKVSGSLKEISSSVGSDSNDVGLTSHKP